VADDKRVTTNNRMRTDALVEEARFSALQLQQAGYEVQLAQRRYEAVDPANRLVAGELEAQWEAALKHREGLTRRFREVAHQQEREIEPKEGALIQELAADMLLRRNAREHYPTLKSYLDPKTDPTLRAVALAGVDEPALQAAATDPTLGNGVFRARLARGEREQAIDWFLAHGSHLQPSVQADAMVDWMAQARPAPAEGKQPTAAKTPTRRQR